MNFLITPKKVILSTFAAVLVTLASFRYIVPIAAISAGSGEMYSLTGAGGLIFPIFFVALIVVFAVISLFDKRKKVQLVDKDNKIIEIDLE